MTLDRPQLVRDKWPDLAAELKSALRAEGENGLAEHVDALAMLEQCGCADDFCQSFYTAPAPAAAYGPGLRNVSLNPAGPGYLILDVVDGVIMFVEVLYRPPLT